MGSRLEANSKAVRKRIENHTFDNEAGEEYGGSSFGGFGQYFRRKKIKLQNLDADIRSRTGDNPPIFRGIVAHVNGYTQPSLNDLHTLIVSHGGGFLQYLDGKTMVTHIIASSLTPKKVVEFRRYRIVKPAWIVDSIQAGRLLPWHEYRVVDEGTTQKVLAFDKGRVTSQINTRSTSYRDQTDASWYSKQLNEDQTVRDRASQSSHGLSDIPDNRLSPEYSSSAQNSENTVEQTTAILEGAEPVNGNVVEGLSADAEQSQGQISQDAPSEFHDPDIAETFQELCSENIEHEPDPPEQPEAVAQALKSTLTAEEHNAILLADPKIRKSTVVNPGFLEQYYRESRLHHLSTWKADLKSQLQALAAEKSLSQRAKQKRPLGARRYIMHVDFDSFFAAVSLKKYPQYKDKPAVVAHSNGTGSEIASCNYPARTYGVKNGMWMKRALDLCPELKTLPYDFPAYEETSRAFYDAILEVGGVVQSVSVDEALVDISMQCIAAGGSDGIKRSEGSVFREQAQADEIATALRANILQRTQCNVSIGIGGNILQAKLALRKAKPAGQFQLRPEEVLDFIGPLPVQDLPGVAWSLGGRLEEMGIKYVKDIRELSKERLIAVMGPKTGEKLWEYSRGVDRAEVGEQVVRKSVSAEVNWGVRFVTQAQVDEFITSLCGELHKRLIKERVKGRQLTMKIMRRSQTAPLDAPKHLGHGLCDTYNKSVALGVATNAPEVIAREALSLLKGYGFSPGELRGIGIQMTKLEPIKDGRVESSQRRLPFKAAEAAKEPVSRVVTPTKSTSGEQPSGSQRRLQFKATDVTRSATPNPFDNTPKGSPSKPSQGSQQRRLQFKATEPAAHVPYAQDDDDPIQDDAESPKKTPADAESDHEYIAPGSEQLLEYTPRKKPLNTLGTQFLIPTQVDPQVLAELPPDIRAKLSRHIRQSSPTPASRHRNPVHASTSTITGLPSHSQLDPEALSALPDDIRAEVLAFYDSPSNFQPGAQTTLPQSPRKNRIIPPPKKPIAPIVPRKRGRPPGSKNIIKPTNNTNANININTTSTGTGTASNLPLVSTTLPTLTQANFVTTSASDASKITEDFLAALPQDIRDEVLQQQQQERDRAAARAARRNRLKNPVVSSGPLGLSTIVLAAKPARPTFTTESLHEARDLRGAIRAWWAAFEDDGPYDEDVAALCKYLVAVVRDERDMSKAVGVVRWVEWVVEDGLDGREGDGQRSSSGEGERKWREAVEKAKECVVAAVRERGLGTMDLFD